MKTLSPTLETFIEPSAMMQSTLSRMVHSWHELVLAPVEPDETLLAVDVEPLVGRDDLGRADLLDLVVLGAALAGPCRTSPASVSNHLIA